MGIYRATSMRKNNRDDALHYDRYAFESSHRRPRYPYKIGFEDFQRSGIETHSVKVHRAGGYPEWLADDRKIKNVLSHALTGAATDSLDELRSAAHAQWSRYLRAYWFTREAAARYRAVQASGFDIARLFAKLVFYYKLGFDSNQISEQCQMAPGTVRQCLSRLNKVARKLYPPQLS